jgi:NAD(P)H-flavin reductase
MNPIKQLSGTITAVRDLSPTAREYTFVPESPFTFIAGAFVNVFVAVDGTTIRRAFSLSSSDADTNSFTLSIRHNPNGHLTPHLWAEDYTGKTVKLMGPLGLNTADKMTARVVYLFGFGVGAGVVKSLADQMSRRSDLEKLVIVTGSRSVAELLHKDYFDTLATTDSRITVDYIVSDKSQSTYPTGYIQDHLATYDFTNANVYMCGQGVACNALEAAIVATNPINCTFLIEDFH